MHQHGRLALGLQAFEHAQQPCHIAAEHRFAEFENVIARHIQHRSLDLLEAQFTGRMQQRELLQFLMCGEQIAFDPISKEGQRALPDLVIGHALALGGQALGQPLRQGAALDRIDLDAGTSAIQRHEPGAVQLSLVEPGQGHQSHHIFRQPSAIALQCFRTVLAGLAGRNADLDQLALRKEAQRLRCALHLSPVEMVAGHGEDLALAIALRSCGSADQVAGLLRQQRFIAVNRVDRAQAFGEMLGKPLSADLHIRLAS